MFAAEQCIRGEGDDHGGQDSFDYGFGHGSQEYEAERDAEQGRQHQHGGAAEVNLAPVLHDNDEGHGDGGHHGDGRRHLDGHDEREQRHGDQRLTKAEGGANEGGQKQYSGYQDRYRRRRHDSLLSRNGPWGAAGSSGATAGRWPPR